MVYGNTKVDLFFLLAVFPKTEIVTLAIVTRKWLLPRRPRTSQKGVVGVWNITTPIELDGKDYLWAVNVRLLAWWESFFMFESFSGIFFSE